MATFLRPLPPLLIDPDLEALATFLAEMPPPAEPLVLGRDRLGRPWLVIEEPGKFWTWARQELADGVRGQHGQSLLSLLRQVKRTVEGETP